MFGNKFSSSTSCSKWLHETEPGRLDHEFSGRFLKVATHPSRPLGRYTPGVTASTAAARGPQPVSRTRGSPPPVAPPWTARRVVPTGGAVSSPRRGSPRGPSARPVSGSVSASDLPDAAVQLHCLDPHGAGPSRRHSACVPVSREQQACSLPVRLHCGRQRRDDLALQAAVARPESVAVVAVPRSLIADLQPAPRLRVRRAGRRLHRRLHHRRTGDITVGIVMALAVDAVVVAVTADAREPFVDHGCIVRAASGGRVEKLGGQKKGPRKTSTPKKKPKQVQLPFAAGSKRAV